MQLSDEFWLTQQYLVLVGNCGSLRFTARGRAHYGPLFARYGFAITNVATYQRFQHVMARVNAGEFEANEREMRRLLCDPNTTEEERALIRRVLEPKP
jgi:hypothetical protein